MRSELPLERLSQDLVFSPFKNSQSLWTEVKTDKKGKCQRL